MVGKRDFSRLTRKAGPSQTSLVHNKVSVIFLYFFTAEGYHGINKGVIRDSIYHKFCHLWLIPTSLSFSCPFSSAIISSNGYGYHPSSVSTDLRVSSATINAGHLRTGQTETQGAKQETSGTLQTRMAQSAPQPRRLPNKATSPLTSAPGSRDVLATSQ